MNIIDGFRRLFSGKSGETTEGKDTPVGYSFNGDELYKDDIVADIKQKLEKRRSERRTFEAQWLLNANFLYGHQYCDINVHTGEIETIEPLFDYSERGVFNRIAPLIETRLANIRTVKYAMTVNPRTSEIEDWEKADISSKLLRYTQSHTNFNSKLSDIAIPWAELTGTSFILSWWDTSKGNEVARIEHVEVDENGEETRTTETIYQGDLNYGVLSSYEVFPESLYKQEIEDQHDIIIEQIMTVEEIYDRYNIKVDGRQCQTYVLSPIAAAGGLGQENSVFGLSRQTVENSETVITYFERKSRAFPEGRTIIIIGDELIYYGPMPYEQIPLVAIKSKIVVGQFYGKSVIQDLIPLQRAYNAVCNKILEHVQNIASNAITVEQGSLIDIDEYIENGIPPNAILEYQKDSKPPQPLQRAPLDQSTLSQYQSLKNDMEYVAGISQLMVYGDTPSGVDSGVAIENLRQIDSTRLSLTTENIRASVKKVAILWLKIYKEHMTGYRVCQIAGSNDVGGVLTWCSDDINSFDVEFDTENELVFSQEKQRQNFIEAWNMGLFRDADGTIPREITTKFLELMKLGRYSDMMGVEDLQRQTAQRENTFFLNGVIPQRGEYDDDDIHLYEHKKFVLQMKFRVMQSKNPEYCARFYAHMKEHEAAIAQKLVAQQQILGGEQGAAIAAPGDIYG